MLKKIIIILTVSSMAFAFSGCGDSGKKPERKIAVQTYTCHKMNLTDAFKLFNELGVKYTEIHGGKLGGDFPDVSLSSNMAPEHIEYLKSICKKYDVTPISYGVVYAKDEAEIRKAFEFAKTMGMKYISFEDDPAKFPIWDKLADEYGILPCVHNHAKHDNYQVWDYKWVAKHIAPYKNIGVCADNGAWTCSGLDGIEALRALKGKIYTVHLKDQKDFGVSNSPAVIYGTGVVPVDEVLQELDAQGYDGYLIIEHGNDGDKREIIAKDIEYIKSH